MKRRLLVIAERAEYVLLVRKHVEIDWPDAVIVEHLLGEDVPLDVQFTASGFDAVVLVGAPTVAGAEKLAVELAARSEFAPVVFLSLHEAPPEPPVVPGLH
ncbi:MAG: hypothetical protein JWN43_3811, partial [Gammaproteobacteria bacterium]|nr:hypothetical protein [Gammaproteobacteria bacterium]